MKKKCNTNVSHRIQKLLKYLLNVVKVIVTLILTIDSQKVFMLTSIVPEEKAIGFNPRFYSIRMAS